MQQLVFVLQLEQPLELLLVFALRLVPLLVFLLLPEPEVQLVFVPLLELFVLLFSFAFELPYLLL